MEKIWLKSYSEHVPAEINPDEFSSLLEVFEQSVSKYREHPAFTNMGVTLTYGDLDRLSRDFAAYLQGKLGCQKGQRLAIMMPNILQYPVAVFGAFRAGMTVVNVNPLYTPRELEHQLKDSGAESIVILANFAHTLAQVIEHTPVRNVIVTEMGDLMGFAKGLLVNFMVKHVKKMVPPYKLPKALSLKDVLGGGHRVSLKPVSLNNEDIAFLQYTGGTTGVSKGAVLTHRNLISNLQQVSVWVNGIVREGEEIIITALPLYHIFCLTVSLAFIKFGALSVLITNPRDMPGFVKTLSKFPFTAMTGVNTLFNGLLHTPGFAELDFSHFHFVLGGGMAVQRAVAEEWQKVTGKALLEGFGLTETSPVVCINPLHLTQYTGSIGLPVPSTDIAIMDVNGKELPLGEVGELCVKGPQVMREYWNNPEETKKMFTADGWLRTGDIAKVDEAGYVKIVDRQKDMILVSGFNVYPNEVEDVVAHHPGVLEVAAIGIPDDKSGEAVKIVVVKKNEKVTEEELIAYCRKELTGYKVPKCVEFRKELPKTNVGKILRRALRNTPK